MSLRPPGSWPGCRKRGPPVPWDPRIGLASGVLWPLSMKRLIAIGFIWSMCAVAWVILGGTIEVRTGESSGGLRSEVHRLWGPPLALAPPLGTSTRPVEYEDKETTYLKNGTPVVSLVKRIREEPIPMPLVGTDATVALSLEQRKKGLLWFPTYAVAFQARYAFQHTGTHAREARLEFPIPSDNVGLEGFELLDGAGQPVPYEISQDAARWTAHFQPGQTQSFQIAFRSRGTSTWHYALTQTGQVKDFKLKLTTDFQEVDFPAGSISPTRHARVGSGWSGEWDFKSLISSATIGLDLPQRLNPGEVASRITFFAPVGLLFFFFVVSILALAQGKNLHPLNYFFLSCAFFAFHLLFAYLVDHLSLAPSFALASVVSIALVVTYARWFVGWKFSLREMGAAQALYLVLFSFTFFWDGFTGLAITVGAILTLFAMMQVTGRLDWNKLAQPQSPPPAAPSSPIGHGTPISRELSGVVEAFAMPPGAPPEARG